MGKILSTVLGFAAIILGIVLFTSWWYDFLIALRAGLPALLVFGGIIAIIAGINEYRDTKKIKN